jgi:hypothetical protein
MFDDKIDLIHNCPESSLRVWTVKLRNKDRITPLEGYFFCDPLFDFKIIQEEKSPSITTTHLLESKDIHIERIVKNKPSQGNIDKETLISIVIEQEVLRLCGGQTKQYFSEAVATASRMENA